MCAELRTLSLLGGVTAAGKTKFAISWALANRAEVLCCDSVAFYRGFDVGSAKPSLEERGKVPHHGLDLCDLSEPIDVDQYHQYAEGVLSDIAERDKKAMVVGGSGFYLEGFLHPVVDEVNISEDTRGEVWRIYEKEGKEGLLTYLNQINPDGLGQLDIHNPVRLLRALERCLESGKSLKELRERFSALPDPYPQWEKRMIWLDREDADLEERIEHRTRGMLAAGLVAEVQYLLKNGLCEKTNLASAVGYREVISYLRGGLDEADLLPAIVSSTRKLVSKQRKWFRKKFPPSSRVLLGREEVMDASRYPWISRP